MGMSVKAGLRLEPWGALRVAGLPADMLMELRLERSAARAADLDAGEAALAAMRERLIDHLFVTIHGCDDRPLRRAMLTLKRSLYNAKPIRPTLSEPVLTRLPDMLRSSLTRLAEAEARIEALAAEYEITFTVEWRAATAALRRLVSDDRLLNGLLLSSSELWQAAQQLASLPADTPLSANQQNREAAVARYLFRAATRTTPFSSFAAVALLPLTEDMGASGSRGDQWPPVDHGHAHIWRSVPQVHAAVLQDWMVHHLSRSARANLPLRVTPVRRVETDPAPAVVFVQTTLASPQADAPPKHLETWFTLRLSPTVQQVMAVADGRSGKEIAGMLAASDEERRHWLDLLDHLVEAGFLERLHPRPEVDPARLRALAAQLESLGDPDAAQRLRWLAELLESYATSPSGRRAELLSKLKEELGLDARGTPIYEDVILEGLTTADLGIEPDVLKEDLLPALALARASLSDVPHRLLCHAFVTRYGVEGSCQDVPGFLVELLQDDAFMSRLRHASAPLGWLDSPLGRAIQAAEGACVQLEPAWFAELPAPNVPCAVAAFVQLSARDRRALESGKYRVVLNGMQSGRNKYLSRYLGNGSPAAEAALTSVRVRLATTYGPLPVEVAPILGINFQIHPPLTQWTLEIPLDAAPAPDRVLPLTDLSLRFDAAARELRVRSARLGCDIEPVHFGFLRDVNLPDPLLLLRAFSPRMREETVTERVDLYNLLERWDTTCNVPLRRYRPRLEVGRLVLERARWAIPLVEVPMKQPRESYAAFFGRLARWRAEQGLPERGFARRLSPGSHWADAATPRFYFDWQSPFTLVGLRRLVLGLEQEPEPKGWLLLTELMPAPEDALLTVNGRPHVSELLIQFEWEPDHG
jgi:hypothetical protein